MTTVDGECRTQRVTLPGGSATWTVLGGDHRVVGPAEEFLEYLRVQGTSPNTVKSYARALALWWTYLSVFGLAWDELALADVGGFLAWAKYAPLVKESAGKKKGRNSTGHGNPYLARILGNAAAAAGRTDTFLGERYRRIARRRGAKRANVAIGVDDHGIPQG